MTAAFDDRSIVRAQQSLASIAYSTQGGRTLSKKQQRQRDAVVEAISQDVVIVDAITIAGSTSYLAGMKPAEIAATWEIVAKQKLVGSGIAASVLWMLFYQWVLPMLLNWAERWLIDQFKASHSVVSYTTTIGSKLTP